MLHCVFSCNDKYFEGLYLLLLSIVRRSKEDYCFTILTADLQDIDKHYTRISDYHLALIDKMIKEFNPNNEVRAYDVSEKYYKAFGKQDIEKYSPYTMLKLFIPDFYTDEKVLYIDTDIMANKDIKSAFDVDMTNTEMCVCHEYYQQHVLKIPNCKYFSGGVWLINIAEVKKTDVFNKAIQYFNQNHPIGNEEGALNATCTKIKYFPNEYDYNYQMQGMTPNVILKHFVYHGQQINIKQWDYVGVRNILELNNWDEDYKYWLAQKKTWIKPKQIYNVLYSCNDAAFEALYLSILSVLRRTKLCLNFYVMSADLKHIDPKYEIISEHHLKILYKLVKSFNSNNTLTLLDCTKKYKATFENKYDPGTFTPYAILRLFADKIKDLEGLVLYLDIDTLANGDIKEAWDVNMDCVEICVCHDYWLSNNKTAEGPIFNSGVMLINLDFIRITKYFGRAINYLLAVKPIMADQEALFHTWYRIKSWKDEYRFNYQQLGIEENTIIKHFNTTKSNAVNNVLIKPWHMDAVQNILKLHNWDNDYAFFINEKKHW